MDKGRSSIALKPVNDDLVFATATFQGANACVEGNYSEDGSSFIVSEIRSN
jgi:hypothetical protein